MRLALATCSAMPGLATDDRPLLAALRQRGHEADPVVWEDRFADWTGYDACVVRSCWDYAYRSAEFLAWVDRTAALCPVRNTPAVLRWNAHKRYLVDLVDRGVPAVPTVVLPAGERARLRQILVDREWPDAVLKAAIGNSGRFARRVTLREAAEGQRYLDRYLPHEDMLVQPLVRSIGTSGELSLVFTDGAFSHAVRKRAARGDFRVHDDYGGSVDLEDPHPEWLEAAQRAIAAAGEPLLYGRVDLVEGLDGEPLVMELELIEPELFLRFAPEAVDRLAAAVTAIG